MDEYVRKFQRAKVRLLAKSGIKQEYIFCMEFCVWAKGGNRKFYTPIQTPDPQ